MKKLAILTLSFFITFGIPTWAQEDEHSSSLVKQLPSVQLVDMEGNVVNTSEMGFDGPVIISFWATWCSPCKRELNTINDVYLDWQEETGVNLVAVSVDDQKTKNSVAVYANGKSWEYLVLMDTNGDFKRAMGVNNVPHTFILNKKGEVVYSHNNYAPGDEEIYYQKIKELAAE